MRRDAGLIPRGDYLISGPALSTPCHHRLTEKVVNLKKKKKKVQQIINPIEKSKKLYLTATTFCTSTH